MPPRPLVSVKIFPMQASFIAFAVDTLLERCADPVFRRINLPDSAAQLAAPIRERWPVRNPRPDYKWRDTHEPIQEYRSTEESIKELQNRLEALKQNPGLQKDITFERSLKELLNEYGKSLRDVISILDPQGPYGRQAKTTGSTKQARTPRKVKVYKNPSNGEIIETKGGNHKGLKAWKQQYGSDVVEGWLQA